MFKEDSMSTFLERFTLSPFSLIWRVSLATRDEQIKGNYSLKSQLSSYLWTFDVLFNAENFVFDKELFNLKCADDEMNF